MGRATSDQGVDHSIDRATLYTKRVGLHESPTTSFKPPPQAHRTKSFLLYIDTQASGRDGHTLNQGQLLAGTLARYGTKNAKIPGLTRVVEHNRMEEAMHGDVSVSPGTHRASCSSRRRRYLPCSFSKFPIPRKQPKTQLETAANARQHLPGSSEQLAHTAAEHALEVVVVHFVPQ